VLWNQTLDSAYRVQVCIACYRLSHTKHPLPTCPPMQTHAGSLAIFSTLLHILTVSLQLRTDYTAISQVYHVASSLFLSKRSSVDGLDARMKAQ
jgi:hypothetical protein